MSRNENEIKNDNEEDFAALFAASVQPKRFDGQTVGGTIVAIGPEVALVNVGAKGEATIELDELKNDAWLRRPLRIASRPQSSRRRAD